MIPEIDTVKGFQDILPPRSIKKNQIRQIVEKYFALYGFLPIETPIVEFDELMKPDKLPSEEEDEAISDRFRLKDKAGRNLGLRYEFTFQLSKLFKINKNIKLPFRRYQIGEVFRDEPISSGRYRQFSQCDVDIIGDSSQQAEADCLALANDIFKELKIEPEIEINNRKLLNSIIESVEIKDVKRAMKELDKMDKIGEDDVKSNLRKFATPNQIITLFKLLEKDISFFSKNAFEGTEEIESLIEKTKDYRIKIKFNPFLVRGLGYYTGNIFEIKIQGEKNTIAAGGRYDNVVGKYIGRELPSTGISFGLDRITDLAKIKIKPIANTLIISINQDKESVKLSKKIRKESISCILTSEKPGKAMDYANALSIPYVVFIGDSEIEKKKFKLKNMNTGEEKYLTEKQLLKTLTKT